jgi:soluble lytic murein transglycosylase-like protein
MRWPAPRGLAGAALAAAAFGAVLASPSPLGEGPRPVPAGAVACGGPACEPGPAGLVDRVEDQLFLRMPDLADLPRRLLARTIVAEAEGARIDPLLVLALIQVESGYDRAALSGRGARGLMQLREPTMRRELERHGLAFDDPHDPVANVRAGVRYLRRLLDAFGREEVALMAYNAGPNRILGYLREGEIPPRFQVYPRRVGAELRRLRRSLGAPPPPALANARVVAQGE